MQQKEGRGSRRFFPLQILEMFNFLNYFKLFGSDPSILAYRWDNVDYVPGEDPEMFQRKGVEVQIHVINV